MEFITECFQPYNGLFTALVLTCMLYWIMVVFGFFGMDIIDLDVEMEGDIGVEVDPTADIADLGSVGLVGGFMRFMHFHQVPFMIVITIISTMSWLLFTLLNFHWNTDQSWTFALTWIVPTLVASLAISKLALQPFVLLFKNVNIPEKKLKDYVGEECIVMTSEVTRIFGTAEIATNESPLIIQIRNETPFKFTRGDRAVLTGYNPAGKQFQIGPLPKQNGEQQNVQKAETGI